MRIAMIFAALALTALFVQLLGKAERNLKKYARRIKDQPCG